MHRTVTARCHVAGSLRSLSGQKHSISMAPQPLRAGLICGAAPTTAQHCLQANVPAACTPAADPRQAQTLTFLQIACHMLQPLQRLVLAPAHLSPPTLLMLSMLRPMCANQRCRQCARAAAPAAAKARNSKPPNLQMPLAQVQPARPLPVASVAPRLMARATALHPQAQALTMEAAAAAMVVGIAATQMLVAMAARLQPHLAVPQSSPSRCRPGCTPSCLPASSRCARRRRCSRTTCGTR